ncbi:type II toxin-antitoxin system Phd/YefM family antitoxin [Haloferula chungangensis]|uniref:Antitoxin n=1 Tax=Haloferula chungangensis TaxID=1048331 RepID=A0ABW2L4V7_9BACT
MNIHEAKTHLSRLVERAAAGEEIIIAKSGKPMAKLVPYTPPISPRSGGFLSGQIWESPDCWEPDEELSQQMTDSPLLPDSSAKVADEEAPYSAEK